MGKQMIKCSAKAKESERGCLLLPTPGPTPQRLQGRRLEGPANGARGNQGGEGPGAAGEVQPRINTRIPTGKERPTATSLLRMTPSWTPLSRCSQNTENRDGFGRFSHAALTYLAHGEGSWEKGENAGLPMGARPCGWGSGAGGTTRHTARKHEREEQGETRRHLDSGLGRGSLGSRTRRVNQGRLPRGGEYGVRFLRGKG